MSSTSVAIFYLVLVLGIIVAIIKLIISYRRDQQETKLQALGPDFHVGYKFFGGGAGIALDHGGQKIGLMPERGDVRVYDFKDIVAVEKVRRDGQVDDRVSRGNQIGRAVVGGALFGVAGAAVGAVSARRKQTAYVSEAGLRIIVDDVAAPVFDLKVAGQHAKGGFIDKAIDGQVEDCYAQVLLAMRRADSATS